MSRLRRFLVAAALFGAVAAWAAYWGEIFFAARGRAEAAMERLQPLIAAGLADPVLIAEVEGSLAQSHRALAFALAGPLAMAAIAFAALWILGRRVP